MESVLNLSPAQMVFMMLLQMWIFVIFPVIIIKKLNYMTDLLEGLYVDNEQDAGSI